MGRNNGWTGGLSFYMGCALNLVSWKLIAGWEIFGPSLWPTQNWIHPKMGWGADVTCHIIRHVSSTFHIIDMYMSSLPATSDATSVATSISMSLMVEHVALSVIISDVYFCHRYWAWVGLTGLRVVLWRFRNVIDCANLWCLRKKHQSI